MQIIFHIMIFPPPSYDKQYWHVGRYFCSNNVDVKSPLCGLHLGFICIWGHKFKSSRRFFQKLLTRQCLTFGLRSTGNFCQWLPCSAIFSFAVLGSIFWAFSLFDPSWSIVIFAAFWIFNFLEHFLDAYSFYLSLSKLEVSSKNKNLFQNCFKWVYFFQ